MHFFTPVSRRPVTHIIVLKHIFVYVKTSALKTCYVYVIFTDESYPLINFVISVNNLLYFLRSNA